MIAIDPFLERRTTEHAQHAWRIAVEHTINDAQKFCSIHDMGAMNDHTTASGSR
jgi:hypothetical protein